MFGNKRKIGDYEIPAFPGSYGLPEKPKSK
jgi:hypothetical protein